ARKSGDKSDDTANAYIFARGEELIALITVTSGEDSGQWDMYALKTANLGTRRFMTATEIASYSGGNVKIAAVQDDVIPVLYARENDKFVLYLLASDATKAAIAAHRISGTVTHHGNADGKDKDGDDFKYDDVELTASPQD